MAKSKPRGRTKRNALPEFAKVTAPQQPEKETEDLASELPVTIDSRAGGMAVWEDLVKELDADAYFMMRTCHPLQKSVGKLATRTAKLNWTIVGKGKRAEAVKEIFGQIQGWTDFIEWLTWAKVEGVRFYQIKTGVARDGSQETWKVPDFFMGGRMKEEAGGDLRWDGNTLVQVLATSVNKVRETKKLPLNQFVIHRPGGGSNPTGDLWRGVALFNSVAKPAVRGITSGDMFMRLFGIPAVMLGAKVDKVRPTVITSALQARADALAAKMGGDKPLALTNADVVQILQANPEGLNGIVEWLRYLESIADDILTMSTLTGGSGIADAERTGDTGVHKDEEDEAAFINGVQIAETFNRYVLPWIFRKNPDLPPLEQPEEEGGEEAKADPNVKNAGLKFAPKKEPGPSIPGTLKRAEPERETEVYLWPADPNEDDAQDVEIETEGSDPNDPMSGPMDESMGGGRGMQNHHHALTVRNAKPSGFVTPPVHPNCRCELSMDEDGNGVWLDAQDSSVCPECRAYGAIYNAIERGPVKLTPAEADAIEDARGSKDYKAAMERDAATEQKAISIITEGELDKDGILSQLVKQRRVTPNAAELNEAIEAALEKSRVGADVRAGTMVGGFRVPEAIIAPRVSSGAVQPQYVAAVVTKGRNYSVVQVNYRWRVFNTRTGKIVGTEESLALALLVFIALEETDRRAREKADRERELAGAGA